eukprot:Gb_35789 [translate_table: standard]
MAVEDEGNDFGGKYVRRYFCRICRVSRSKRILLKRHILSHHGQEALEKDGRFTTEANDRHQKHLPPPCEECGASFTKSSHLEQHKLSHSTQYKGGDCLGRAGFVCDGTGSHPNSTVVRECLNGLVPGWVTSCEDPSGFFPYLAHAQYFDYYQRPFACPIDGCHSNYKRQDHLNRHLLKHEGKSLLCPREGCNSQLTTSSNYKRHLKQHEEKGDLWHGRDPNNREVKQYCCPETACGKAFKYPSRLVKHLDDVHSSLDYVEVICCEPGCLKYFTNAEALKEHVRLNHRHIKCEICGRQHLKKEIKRHMRSHESQPSVKRIQCHFEGCMHSYARKSNLDKHIKAVHLGLRPYKCRFGGCEMTFAYRAVRDRHEMTGRHCYTEGDFVEEDALFQSRPRGGRKRKSFTVDSLFRKRVACSPREATVLESGPSLFNCYCLHSSKLWEFSAKKLVLFNILFMKGLGLEAGNTFVRTVRTPWLLRRLGIWNSPTLHVSWWYEDLGTH